MLDRTLRRRGSDIVRPLSTPKGLSPTTAEGAHGPERRVFQSSRVLREEGPKTRSTAQGC